MTDIYKYAAQNRLRFQSPRGTVALEDLFDLSLEDLDQTARSLRQLLRTGEDTLFEYKNVDKKVRVSYELVVDVFETKKDDARRAVEREAKRQRKQRIRKLMATKQDEDLAAKSLEELEALLNED